MKEKARKLRKEPTESESKLWNLLRNRKFMGLKFRRQHPIIYSSSATGHDYYIVDFYCAELLMIIELDGGIHDIQKEDDEYREQRLCEMGYNIIRFRNQELNTLHTAMHKLYLFVKKLKFQN